MGIAPRSVAWVAVVSVFVGVATADDVPTVDAVPLHSGHVLPAGTEVHLRLLDPVASNTHKHGDHFSLEVVEPLLVDGITVVPLGARAQGEVVHAAKGGFGGRAGELILASRSIAVDDQTIKLRSFSAGTGANRVNLAMGLSFVVVGIFVTGKDIALPKGTDVWAKLAADYSPTVHATAGPALVDSAAASTSSVSSSMPDPATSTSIQTTATTNPPSQETKNDENPQP